MHNANEFSNAVNRRGKQCVFLLINSGGNTFYVIVEAH